MCGLLLYVEQAQQVEAMCSVDGEDAKNNFVAVAVVAQRCQDLEHGRFHPRFHPLGREPRNL